MATNYYTLLTRPGLLLLLGVFFHIGIMAQAPKVLFTSGVEVFPQNINSFNIKADVKEGEIIHGNYYRFVQFHQIPNQEIQNRFKSLGIEVMDYIPHNAYLMSIPEVVDRQELIQLGVRSIVRVGLNQKVDAKLWELPRPDYTLVGQKLKATILHYNDIPHEYVLNQLAAEGVEILQTSPDYANITVVFDPVDLGAIALLPFVKFIEQMPPPPEKEDTGGRTLQRSNQINVEFHGGLKYNAEGVNMLVRDDGGVGPHVDYKGRLINLASSGGGTHGDGVAGVMGGAGNIDPDIEGGASGATILATDYFANFLDQNTVNAFTNDDVVITNSSYSNGCNAGYTTIAQTVDQQVRDNINLMHVFSAGNSNNSDCGYGAGNQWGNVTGGHKVGKNVIAVANLFDDESLVGSSSRGPAHDGRIKPEIAAHGQGQLSTDPNNAYQSFGGTSAAAPSSAGNMGQLYQYYKEANAGVNPPSALIKAAVMNTAHDLGNPGPDFKYGFGRIHTYRAYELLRDNHYLLDTISQAGANNHVIQVPAGVHEMRIMLYWADPAASVNASKALINDLDMTLSDGGATYMPYVLNIAPNPDSLDKNAVHGVDTLNNVEQIAVFNPAAGAYTVDISGTEVPVGPQGYVLVYTFITEDLKLTYPLGGEGLVPGTQEWIHWDAIDDTQPFTVQYSVTGGAFWTNIATNVSSDLRQLRWTVPNLRTGNAKVRVIRGASTSESEENFSIMPLATGIQFLRVCPDSITFSWTAVGGADSYDAFVLGDRYMDSVGHTTGTQITVPISNGFEDNWVAVRARTNAGAVGRRTNAVQAPTALLNCGTDAGMVQVASPTGIIQSCALGAEMKVRLEIEALGEDTLYNIPAFYSYNGGAFVQDTIAGPVFPNGNTYIFEFQVPIASPSAPGTYTILGGITSDVYPGNDTIRSTFELINGTVNTIPYSESFDNFILCATSSLCGDVVCGLSNGWINLANGEADDADWRVNSNTTPSAGTGPNGDYSASGNGRYLYTEASNGCTDARNFLMSPCIDLTTATSPGLAFAYHMLDDQANSTSTAMGELHVDIFDGSGWVNDVIVPFVGNQGANWQEAQVDLNPYKGKVINIRWRGITGSDFRSDIAIDAVSICNAPVSSFNTTYLGGSNYAFQNTTSGAGGFVWLFGDGQSSSQANPTHTYTANDTFLVQLVTFGTCGAGTDTATQQVIVTGVQAPVSDFTISDNRVCINEWVVFTGTSTGLGIDFYNFNFGSNASIPSTSFAGPVRVRYSQRGTKTVRFVTGNSAGRDTVFKTVEVLDVPVADFDINANGLSIQFNENSLDGLNYTWKFGDGNTATGSMAMHTYQDTGLYDVTLIVTNECGTDSLTKTIAAPGLNADFGFSMAKVCVGQFITISDSSTGLGINAYSWNFGSNASVQTTNSLGPHTLTFSQPGLETVQLVVTNANGEIDTVQKTILVEAEPVAGFSTRSDNGNNIDFSADSTNAITYFWDFGDGATATTPVANHIYTQNGSYVVVLAVSNECGSDTITQVLNVSSVNLQNFLEMGISIYPNPSEGKFTVTVENLMQKETHLAVLDMKGKEVYKTAWSSSITGARKNIEIPGLAKGVYLLQVEHGDRTGYTKLLIEK